LFTSLAVSNAHSTGIDQEIWFGPRQPTRPALDWNQLFRSDEKWRSVQGKINTLVLQPSFIDISSDNDLSAIIQWLSKRHIALAIAIQPIAKIPGENCGGIEGYAYPGELRRTAEKLRKIGARVRYITMDEPLLFGQYTNDPKSCTLNTEELVRRVSLNLTEFVQLYPDLEIVHIEPIPGLLKKPSWGSDYLSFENGLQQTLGKRSISLQLDVDWENANWIDDLANLHSFSEKQGLRLGIIYNGTYADPSNNAWIRHAVENYTIIESNPDLIPQQAVFLSWDAYPDYILPEGNPATQSGLINSYIKPRTRILVYANSQRTVRGRVVSEQGRPIRETLVTMLVSGLGSGLSLSNHELNGSVPVGAATAMLGIRLNAECNCNGSNDLYVAGITYKSWPMRKTKKAEDVKVQRYSVDDSIQYLRPQETLEAPHKELIVDSSHELILNSPRFNVSDGEHWALQFRGGSRTSKGIFGYFVILWFDKWGKELKRSILTDREDLTPIRSSRTDSNGYFHIRRGNDPEREQSYVLSVSGGRYSRPARINLE
jgi:hypothetical protein